ncbi:MAG: twin-arginine translocase subunit TatC [Bacteroidota bacterium]
MLKNLKSKNEIVPKQDEAEMSFLDHLDVLRKHIVRSLIAIVIIGCVLFVIIQPVFDEFIFAHKDPDFISYRLFCNYLRICMTPPELNIITTELAEEFFQAIKVSFYGGLLVAFPYVFYQIWSFIKPGLYAAEQKAARGVVFVCSFLFLVGTTFGYFILAPFAINFLVNFRVSQAITSTVTLSSYVGYMTMFILPTGILFQLPLLVYFLAKIGLITPEFMRNYRKHAFVIILIMSAILTPPDVVTQFMIGVPVYGMYELSIFVAARTARKREKELNS